jgi:hypothetical protein
MTLFDARPEKGQVDSCTVIDADLGVGNQHLIVTSGIVKLGWTYDSDQTYHGGEKVLLNVFAGGLVEWSAFVGLAAIANDNSGFVFAADTARVEGEPSGELALLIDDALMGESSTFHRFSYQVVAKVIRTPTAITGSITWPSSLYRPPSDDPRRLVEDLSVVANRDESATGTDLFSPEHLTPVASAYFDSFHAEQDRCVVTYRIANPPMGMALKVTSQVQEHFLRSATAAVGIGRIAGPDVFTLSPSQPAVAVDFGAAALPDLR